MSNNIGSLAFLVLIFAAPNNYAWDNHALPTVNAVLNMHEVAGARKVEVESLEVFLSAEQELLVALLRDEEEWAQKNLSEYQPRPAKYSFRSEVDTSNIRSRFLNTMRFNPNARLTLYLQELPNIASSLGGELTPGAVTLLPDSLPTLSGKFRKLQVGEFVDPIAVFSSASDEPDYGLDIGLFADNTTKHGKNYGLGTQPYGGNVEYSSQAPLHMGFYHEWGLLEYLANQLTEPLVEYRIHQFYTLSRFAFERGHDYWGWRFAGMGAHYLQDMTQPYHATVMPGENTLFLLGTGLLDKLGITGPKERFAQQATDEHTAFEKYIVCRLVNEQNSANESHPMLDALRDGAGEKRDGYTNTYVRGVVAKESNSLANQTADAIESYVVSRSWKAPGCNFAKGRREPLFEQLMRNFAAHTRSFIRSVRSGVKPQTMAVAVGMLSSSVSKKSEMPSESVSADPSIESRT